MKKSLALLLVLFAAASLNAQDTKGKEKEKDKDLRVFKTVFHNNGSEKYDTVKQAGQQIDIQFMKKYFKDPAHLPDALVNRAYKDTMLVIWGKEDAPQDHNANWTNMYQYDKASRLVYYGYSGCGTCQAPPYEYNVIYDAKGRLIKIALSPGIHDFRDFYDLHYNDKDELDKLQYYAMDKLVGEIILVK